MIDETYRKIFSLYTYYYLNVERSGYDGARTKWTQQTIAFQKELLTNEEFQFYTDVCVKLDRGERATREENEKMQKLQSKLAEKIWIVHSDEIQAMIDKFNEVRAFTGLRPITIKDL